MREIRAVQGDGVISLQTKTDSAPGRPFPAFEVIAELYVAKGNKLVLRLADRIDDLVWLESIPAGG